MANMSVKVLGVSSSPRLGGNSELLLKKALEGAAESGAQIEYVRLADLTIAPCLECNYCFTTGRCRIEDDFQAVMERILEADRLYFAAPIFFMTVPAQAKLLIDRCQCLWARKTVLKKPLVHRSQKDRFAMVIAVGASKSTKMFESVRLTLKSYFNLLDLSYRGGLFVNKVDDLGDIEKKPQALTEAFNLGKKLALIETEAPKEPLEIELI